MMAGLGGAYISLAEIYALQVRLLTLFYGVPYQFFLMLPYTVTIVALVMTAKRGLKGAPASLGQPYVRE